MNQRAAELEQQRMQSDRAERTVHHRDTESTEAARRAANDKPAGAPGDGASPPAAASVDEDHQMPSWHEVFLYFLLLGFINVGGPVAQITMMFNHMVERRRWLSP